ncbi:ComEA family DNA-binding protein [Streptomyces sp. NBC_00091]|uniref:ComEA family DNA-binding protein n=1 Tax=Streptomyces sp. NBC_00091 TaxID=2975648 RepID=UPI0022545A10|nr:ComEA family DNA-binding protein [Streptomyces sp. NBC_00091]MCX5378402.1 ComEA family DNA-binding protein [Streptomyces sp. NBC_00091]
MRRRAEALLAGGSPAARERESGAVPGVPEEAGALRVADPPPDVEPWLGAYPRAWPDPVPLDPVPLDPVPLGGVGVPGGVDPAVVPGGSVAAREAVGVLGVGAAGRLALRERLPVWVQVRCGVEPRTVAAVAVVLVLAVGFAAQQYWSGRPQPVTAPAVVTPAPAPAPPAASGAPGGGEGARIVVDVGGKVRDPGLRRLPSGSRVEDALAAAGGVRPGTDTTGLNRARVLVDGEQVLVGATAQPPPGGPGPGAGAGAGPLSLGSATVEQLDGLPGVGPVLARNIVDFRTARGGFRAVEDLRQVDGIGERRFAELRRLVRP